MKFGSSGEFSVPVADHVMLFPRLMVDVVVTVPEAATIFTLPPPPLGVEVATSWPNWLKYANELVGVEVAARVYVMTRFVSEELAASWVEEFWNCPLIQYS